ncbi:MAG: tRNA (adenosine(37)-N6)-dimethylallyltransferase MiaA [Candidatus Coatesbacteria bacterium]|nr:tRNA (adenosine(37)-N6)-dimethylallyltransferase MiaA [Candidatus Coatesbacteria bacterium]
MKRMPLIVMAGPTAIGKTHLVVEVAKEVPIEIISADSRQIYRMMDIGTGKPTLEEQQVARHHLIDIKSPGETFSAAEFAQEAIRKINEIRNRGILPVVVGGTFLYLRALLWGFFETPPKSDEIRTRLKNEIRHLGSARLHRRLIQMDPDAAKAIHENDQVRIIRALEIIETTGKTISKLKMEQPAPNAGLFSPLIFALMAERGMLNQRIDARVDHMFSHGFVEEVRGLLDAGFSPDLNSFSSLGYRFVSEHIEGRLTVERAIDATKTQSRRYAKRQMVWLKHDWGFHFLDSVEPGANIAKLVGECKKVLHEIME